MDHDPQYTLAQIERLRAERDALERRLREVRAQLNDVTDRHRERVVMNVWAEQKLARHGIQACLYPNCVGGQSGTVCHKHCPTPCPDCRGLGYDASGQLCACQQNPSF